MDDFDKNTILSVTDAPPVHGELSTSGSVLGPLPNIASSNSYNKRQKRPTSAGLLKSSNGSIGARVHNIDYKNDNNKNSNDMNMNNVIRKKTTISIIIFSCSTRRGALTGGPQVTYFTG